MLHFHDRATMAQALTLDLEPRLHRLLAERIGSLDEELIDYTEYLVVQAGDEEDDIIRHVGFSPLVEPIDGARFGEAGFRPWWDWLGQHDGWYEMIVTAGSTFAYILLIEDGVAATSRLAALCKFYL